LISRLSSVRPWPRFPTACGTQRSLADRHAKRGSDDTAFSSLRLARPSVTLFKRSTSTLPSRQGHVCKGRLVFGNRLGHAEHGLQYGRINTFLATGGRFSDLPGLTINRLFNGSLPSRRPWRCSSAGLRRSTGVLLGHCARMLGRHTSSGNCSGLRCSLTRRTTTVSGSSSMAVLFAPSSSTSVLNAA
jgi:hypothetical protein